VSAARSTGHGSTRHVATRAERRKLRLAELADVAADVNMWVTLIRAARLKRHGQHVKTLALLLASYASPDGTRVFPGVAQLAVILECDYRTVRRGLAVLRDAGLIALVMRGARRLGEADEYRLIIAADVLERLDVLSPDEIAAEVGAVRARMAGSTGHPCPVEPKPNRVLRVTEPVSTGHSCDPPPSITTLHKPGGSVYTPTAGSPPAAASNGQPHRRQSQDQDQDQAPPRWDHLARARRQLAEARAEREKHDQADADRIERELARLHPELAPLSAADAFTPLGHASGF
jgi:hypothetical protein